MKVLVTGATGYAGFYAAISLTDRAYAQTRTGELTRKASVLCYALRQAGHQVYALTRDNSKPRAIELQKHEVQIAEGDIKQPETYYAAWQTA